MRSWRVGKPVLVRVAEVFTVAWLIAALSLALASFLALWFSSVKRYEQICGIQQAMALIRQLNTEVLLLLLNIQIQSPGRAAGFDGIFHQINQ